MRARPGSLPLFPHLPGEGLVNGVVRNVARRFESQPKRPAGPLPEIAANEASLSRLFERSWAQAIMAEAAQLQGRQAGARSPEAIRRIELLRLRFEVSLPSATMS